jgi:predicted NUDIX family phosphoesterase
VKREPLDPYEERVVRDVLDEAIRQRQRRVTERHSVGVGGDVPEIRALTKARELLTENTP